MGTILIILITFINILQTRIMAPTPSLCPPYWFPSQTCLVHNDFGRSCFSMNEINVGEMLTLNPKHCRWILSLKCRIISISTFKSVYPSFFPEPRFLDFLKNTLFNQLDAGMNVTNVFNVTKWSRSSDHRVSRDPQNRRDHLAKKGSKLVGKLRSF